MAKATKYYIQLGTIKYGFSAVKDNSAKLGGALKSDNVAGVVFGANSPKPPTVRCRLANGKTATFFVKPGTDITTLTGKTASGSKIVGVPSYV